ncbi:MAG: thioether cross-link-forming SCIFF peptide maturase [Oscillospiraceae bacterium]|jgi:uncharacterized protein|nr:thioether cross-link-forming SCIFF peptide maturase [Oscillospiraceae bacterium]
MIHTYKLNGCNIVIDTNSGAVHSVDDLAYDIILLYGTDGDDEIVRRALLGHKQSPDVTRQSVLEALGEIRQLVGAGLLFSPDSASKAAAGLAERRQGVRALCLHVSHACNMSCDYCFAGGGRYRGAGALMALDTGKEAVDFLIRSCGGARVLDIDFFGGEPLLNWDVVKGVVAYARAAEDKHDKLFRFTLTTNGVLIDDDVIEFCNREIYNVVLSLDGRREVHDRRRKLGGAGSYDTILPKFKKFVAAREGRSYYMRGTYTSANTDFAADIVHMADLGFTELSMEPVVAAPDGAGALGEDDIPALFEQYEWLAEEMLRREGEGRGFTFYHYTLDLTGGPCIYKRASGCGSGSEYLAVSPEGDLYPCHRFVGEPAYMMGDVRSGVTNARLREEFRSCGIYSRRECRECWARLYCSGGCAANSYFATGSIEGVYGLGCSLFKKRLECAVMMAVRRAEAAGNGAFG